MRHEAREEDRIKKTEIEVKSEFEFKQEHFNLELLNLEP
jgi:hypothetical protein